MQRLWLTVGSIVTIVVLVVSSVSVLNVLAREEVDETYSFAAEGITQLIVDSHDGSIEVTAADTDTITVDARIRHGLRRTRHSVQVQGDVLDIRARCPRISQMWCRVNYRITVPDDVSVEVISRNGRVQVTGITSTVDVRTSNGPISLHRIGGDVTARTSNGYITAEALSGSRVRAHTSNGPIQLGFTAAPDIVDARTSNGPIEVIVPDDDTSYDLDMTTSNGPTDGPIRTDPTAEHSIRARTSNGPITVRYP